MAWVLTKISLSKEEQGNYVVLPDGWEPASVVQVDPLTGKIDLWIKAQDPDLSSGEPPAPVPARPHDPSPNPGQRAAAMSYSGGSGT